MAVHDITPRMQQIVLALLNENGPVPVKQLADQIHISKRTVQRELEYIPRVLKKYGLTFCSKTGTGIWLEGDKDQMEALKAELEEDDALDVSDRIERQKRLTLEILKDKTLKKLYYYS
ncbi:MAG: HTH domain-containing protein, partial [Lacrimispora sphenoides]